MGYDWGGAAETGGWKPEKKGFDTGLSSLDDGEYYFLIEGVEQREIPNGAIVELELAVIGGPKDGTKVKRPTWIQDPDGLNRWGVDLKTLGFDVDGWRDMTLDADKRKAKFSEMMALALSCLTGLKFKGKKTTSDKKDKNGNPYQNVYINERGSDDGRPAHLDEAEMRKIAATPEF